MSSAALDSALSYTLPGGAHVLFTTRAHGNLSRQSGDGHERARVRRDRLCAELGLRRLCAGRQVHGAVVQHVTSVSDAAGEPLPTDVAGEPLPTDADGHVTALPAVGVMVLAADCLPVALAREGAVAMLHAGWRGLAAGVLEQGVRALAELPGGDRDVVAVIGPGAGPCCYEVGPEVHAAFACSSLADADREGGRIDLRAIARERLQRAGVATVLDAPACTICDERFFSHRREGARAGRQAGVAWLS